ncbi:hypothetical protein GCM10023323_40420 [Streptomyces thinghirensis]|uniref:Uncharacterized protein n=1 Tax=Streptomyces thinghirensis TaxID=551547 RepID=A0ABP9T7Z9_9ACTN
MLGAADPTPRLRRASGPRRRPAPPVPSYDGFREAVGNLRSYGPAMAALLVVVVLVLAYLYLVPFHDKERQTESSSPPAAALTARRPRSGSRT